MLRSGQRPDDSACIKVCPPGIDSRLNASALLLSCRCVPSQALRSRGCTCLAGRDHPSRSPIYWYCSTCSSVPCPSGCWRVLSLCTQSIRQCTLARYYVEFGDGSAAHGTLAGAAARVDGAPLQPRAVHTTLAVSAASGGTPRPSELGPAVFLPAPSCVRLPVLRWRAACS